MKQIRLKRLRKELNLSKDELIELFKSHNLEMVDRDKGEKMHIKEVKEMMRFKENATIAMTLISAYGSDEVNADELNNCLMSVTQYIGYLESRVFQLEEDVDELLN